MSTFAKIIEHPQNNPRKDSGYHLVCVISGKCLSSLFNHRSMWKFNKNSKRHSTLNHNKKSPNSRRTLPRKGSYAFSPSCHYLILNSVCTKWILYLRLKIVLIGKDYVQANRGNPRIGKDLLLGFLIVMRSLNQTLRSFHNKMLCIQLFIFIAFMKTFICAFSINLNKKCVKPLASS